MGQADLDRLGAGGMDAIFFHGPKNAVPAPAVTAVAMAVFFKRLRRVILEDISEPPWLSSSNALVWETPNGDQGAKLVVSKSAGMVISITV